MLHHKDVKLSQSKGIIYDICKLNKNQELA
jgi:hypothetical protein